MSINRKSNHVISWRVRKKYELILYKGGKCERCGYSNLECPNVFNFHHIDANMKDFTISGKSFSFQKLKNEVDKCQLLCANCHGEVHSEPYKEIYLSLINPKPCVFTRKEHSCKACNTSISSRATHCKPCRGKLLVKYSRPSKEQLILLKKKYSMKEIAIMYKCPIKTAYKWVENDKKDGTSVEN